MADKELLLCGYLRHILHNNLPINDIIQTLLHFVDIDDEWDKESLSPAMSINDVILQMYGNVRSVPRTDNISRGGRGGHGAHSAPTDFAHAFGSDSIKRGQIKAWKILIGKSYVRNPRIMIGIIIDSNQIQKFQKNSAGNFTNSDDSGFGVYLVDGSLYHGIKEDCVPYISHHEFVKNDIITVILDMKTSKKSATLEFVVHPANEYENVKTIHDNAYSDIDITKRYKLAVAMFNDATLYLLPRRTCLIR